MESVAYCRTPGCGPLAVSTRPGFHERRAIAGLVLQTGSLLVPRLERPEDNLQGSNLKKQGQSDTGGHHRNGSENFHYALIVRLREEY
jgi:hypothetical protein